MAKVCTKCGVPKSIEEFYRHPTCVDGHIGECKECKRAYVLLHRDKNEARIRAYDKVRRSRPERKADIRQAVHAHNLNNPQKHAARRLVAAEIKAGRLARIPCEECGNPDSEGHHPDYSKPLEVVFLCKQHHAARHKKERKQYGTSIL